MAFFIISNNVSAWYDTTCKTRQIIGTNNTNSNQVFVVNNSNLYYGNVIRTINYTNMYIYNCSGTYKIANDTSLLNYYNSQTFIGNNQYSLFPNSLVAFYTFDEGTGSSVNDSTQNKKVATNNIPLWNASGKLSNAFNGNGGATSYITLPDLSAIPKSANWTIELWYKDFESTSSGDANMLFSCVETSVSTSQEFKLYASGNNGNITIATWTDGSTNKQLNSPIGTRGFPNTWHYLVITFNSTSGAKMYINGTFVKQGQLDKLTATIDKCKIGNAGSGSAGYSWNGTIDEVYLYNKTLTESEILNRYYSYSYVESQELYACPVIFNIKDSMSSEHLTSIGILCTGNETYYADNQNSPFSYNFIYGNNKCRLNATGYFNKNTSFSCFNNTPLDINMTMDKSAGLTLTEHEYLINMSNYVKIIYLLQSVQGSEIYPTNNTCVDDNTLKHEYITEVCLNNDCSNLTIKQSNVYCPYGCITESNAYNASCKEPDWLMWIVFIIIISIGIIIAYYLGSK